MSHNAHMLAELEQLALNIAAISRAARDMEDGDGVMVLRQIIRHLEWTLYELVTREGMLTGAMPWWQE